MNEELRIVIKAITEEAQKELEGVKKELEKINKAGENTSKGLSESFSKVAKTAAVVAGAITAVVGAMIALTKNSMEFQKAYSKLTTSFQAVGSSAEQAKSTYRDLYGFLGDTDRATEAAQSLALITTNTKDLAEWTNILQGAYSLMGDKLPVEGLAEAANETIKTGVVTSSLADAINWLGVSEDAVNAKLATLNTQAEREAYLRELLNGLYSNSAAIYERNNEATIAYNQSQADLDIALANATQYVVPLLTQLNNLGASLLQVLAPAFKYVAAFVAVFVEYVSAAIQWVGAFFGMFAEEGSKATQTVTQGITEAKSGVDELASGLSGSFEDATAAAKELKKQTMGFDELNIVSSNKDTGAASNVPSIGAGGVSGAAVSIPDMGGLANLEDFQKDVEKVREKVEGVLVLVGLVAVALLAWKLTSFIQGLMSSTEALKGFLTKMQSLGGWLMIIAGAILLVQGYSDAWANGIDWENFGLILAGIGLIVGGLVVAFGPLAGAIGLIVGGIAMLVLGIKDLVENGYSMEAVIMVAVAAIAILIGVVWALNAALLANPITWIVVAIMALVAVFVILWNECEGFRNFWISIWDAIVVAFTAVWEWLKQAAKDIAQFFVDAWNAIKKAWSATGKWFSDVWQSIKKAFSAVGKWFSDIFTGAWNGIKKAFSAVGSFFSGIWSTIKNTFSKVGKTIGDAVSGAFKSAINWVLEKAIGIINGFIKGINLAISVINAIPGVSIKKLSLLEVPKLAKGGIVDSATLAMIGERGKEAVLPLENNTGWMDTLAERISAKQGAPSKIVLMLDGKELGYAAINSINTITRQTGTLQLNIV